MQVESGGKASTILAEARVLFDGVPGSMLYASANQVSSIVPYSLSVINNQLSEVQVEYQGQLSDSFSVATAASTPGIFSVNSSGSGQALVLDQDGTPNSANNPAAAGSVITLYATGGGQTSPSGQDGLMAPADNPPQSLLPVTVQIGNQSAEVLYAGAAPGMVEGIWLINLRIPDGLTVGSSLPIVLQVGGQTSQTGISIAVSAASSTFAGMNHSR
jgi:uncharacterized protein (TIGR03437 family)